MPDNHDNRRFRSVEFPPATSAANSSDSDLIMERILDNLNTTPIGKVLKRIASLPEVRKGKVLNVRRQLTEGRYDLNERLDIALDRILEELTT